MQNRLQGYSLIELIVVLTIIAIISLFSIPAVMGNNSKHQAESTLHQLSTSLAYARTTAIQLRQTTEICPKGIQPQSCGQDWSKGWWIFIGKTTQQELHADAILKSHAALPNSQQLTFRAFPKSNSVQFNSHGQAIGNGKFTLLVKNTSQLCFNNQLILSKTGRIRLEQGLASC